MTSITVWLLMVLVRPSFDVAPQPLLVDHLPTQESCQKLGEEMRNKIAEVRATPKSDIKVACLAHDSVVPVK